MFSMTFEPQGHGWARCIVTDAAGSRVFTTSLIFNDPLGDLLCAISVLADGATEERVSFPEEPGEYRWLFQRLPRSDPVMIRLRVISLSDWSQGRPDEAGTENFRIELPLIDLCIATRAMARAVLKDYGKEEFLPLSQASFDRLERYLSQ